MLTPQQLEIISNEYYIKGFVHGRNRLYTHMKSSYPAVFDSRDAIGEWLKYKEGKHERPRDSFSSGPQNPEEPHSPCNAMRHTTACLSRACLWLGSLLWGEY